MARKVLGKVGLTVSGKAIDVEAIFDVGATRSFVSSQLATNLFSLSAMLLANL